MWMTMLWWDHSNETSSLVISHDAIYLVCSSQPFEAVEEILWCDHRNKTFAFGNSFTWHFSLQKRGIWPFLWEVKIRSLAWMVTLGFLACNWQTGTLFMVNFIALQCLVLPIFNSSSMVLFKQFLKEISSSNVFFNQDGWCLFCRAVILGPPRSSCFYRWAP